MHKLGRCTNNHGLAFRPLSHASTAEYVPDFDCMSNVSGAATIHGRKLSIPCTAGNRRFNHQTGPVLTSSICQAVQASVPGTHARVNAPSLSIRRRQFSSSSKPPIHLPGILTHETISSSAPPSPKAVLTNPFEKLIGDTSSNYVSSLHTSTGNAKRTSRTGGSGGSAWPSDTLAKTEQIYVNPRDLDAFDIYTIDLTSSLSQHAYNGVLASRLKQFSWLKKNYPFKEQRNASNEENIHKLVQYARKTSNIICFCDGASFNNPGPCGAGITIEVPFFSDLTHLPSDKLCALSDPKHNNPNAKDYVDFTGRRFDISLSFGSATNNYGEMKAIEASIASLDNLILMDELNITGKTIYILTDSNWSVQILTRLWKAKEQYLPLATSIRAKIMLFQKKHQCRVVLSWVKGHFDISGNEKADELANAGAQYSQTIDSPLLHDGHLTSHSRVTFLEYKATRLDSAFGNHLDDDVITIDPIPVEQYYFPDLLSPQELSKRTIGLINERGIPPYTATSGDLHADSPYASIDMPLPHATESKTTKKSSTTKAKAKAAGLQVEPPSVVAQLGKMTVPISSLDPSIDYEISALLDLDDEGPTSPMTREVSPNSSESTATPVATKKRTKRTTKSADPVASLSSSSMSNESIMMDDDDAAIISTEAPPAKKRGRSKKNLPTADAIISPAYTGQTQPSLDDLESIVLGELRLQETSSRSSAKTRSTKEKQLDHKLRDIINATQLSSDASTRTNHEPRLKQIQKDLKGLGEIYDDHEQSFDEHEMSPSKM